MKYPETLIIELTKKNKSKNIITKNFKFKNVKISRNSYDCRSGVNYDIVEVKDYDSIIEIELKRSNAAE